MFQLNPIGNRVGIDFPKIFHVEWSLPFQIGMFGRKYTGERKSSLDSREKQRPFYSLLFSSTGGANLYKLVYIYIYWYIHIFCSVFSISFDFDIRFDILEEKMIPSNLAVISCSIGLKTANYLKSHFWWIIYLIFMSASRIFCKEWLGQSSSCPERRMRWDGVSVWVVAASYDHCQYVTNQKFQSPEVT